MIDHSLFSVGMIYGILLSLVPSFFFIGMGILLGSLCNEKSIGGVASILIMGQSLLSGMWFPPEGLGEGVLIAMRVLPFKNATDLLQGGFMGYASAFHDFWRPLLILLTYAVVVFVVAVFVFKRKMQEK